MMTRARFRQTARLERLAEGYLRPREKADSGSVELVREFALIHTANLSALILYGDPKIDEPLLFAWKRCLESAEWQRRREKYGGWDEYGRDTCGDPFVDLGAERIAKYFRKYFLPDVPGSDEVEKFGLIFENAPPWLLWFTYGDVNAQILGIKLPDLSAVNRYIRDPRNFGNDQLPPGPFECRLRADGREDEVVIWTKYFLMRKNQKNAPNDVTPRERKRLHRIREKYEAVSKPWGDQEVVTKIAELRLLTRISGLDHFGHYFGDC
jgi:hypothetical protein